MPLTWERETPVPDWLRGSYIKNGPSQKRFGTEDRWYAQYMDSWAKLNKITFTGDGEVLYSGRMIESKNYLRGANIFLKVLDISLSNTNIFTGNIFLI